MVLVLDLMWAIACVIEWETKLEGEWAEEFV